MAWLKVLSYVNEFAKFMAFAEMNPNRSILAEIKFDPYGNKYAFRVLGPASVTEVDESQVPRKFD